MRDRLSGLSDQSFDSCVIRVPEAVEPGPSDILRYLQSGSLDPLPGVDFWRTVGRVLRPGAHLAVLAGAVSWDLTGLGVRSAGFQSRDALMIVGPPSGPILLFRKPLAEATVFEQALKTGTGALSIEGCRVSTSESLNGGAYSPGGRSRPLDGDARSGASLGMYLPGQKARKEYEQPNGRWPPNLVLVHAAGCRRSGVKAVRGRNPRTPDKPGAALGGWKNGWGERSLVTHARDGIETVDVWECRDDCPVKVLDGQSGGAARFYPQFEDEPAMLDWVTRLITPAGGRVLNL